MGGLQRKETHWSTKTSSPIWEHGERRDTLAMRANGQPGSRQLTVEAGFLQDIFTAPRLRTRVELQASCLRKVGTFEQDTACPNAAHDQFAAGRHQLFVKDEKVWVPVAKKGPRSPSLAAGGLETPSTCCQRAKVVSSAARKLFTGPRLGELPCGSTKQYRKRTTAGVHK